MHALRIEGKVSPNRGASASSQIAQSSNILAGNDDQTPEFTTGLSEKLPIYVNAKQYARILERRVARLKLENEAKKRTEQKSEESYQGDFSDSLELEDVQITDKGKGDWVGTMLLSPSLMKDRNILYSSNPIFPLIARRDTGVRAR